MEKQLEYFDILANSQKQVLNNLVSAQKDLRTQWLDGINKVHSNITNLPGIPDTAQTKEALNQYNAWFNHALTTAKTLSDEALKVQENLNSAFGKQLDINREVVKSFSEYAKTAAEATVKKAA